MIPFPAAPAAPVNVVNRFQSLGPIPTQKPYSLALDSKPKQTNPLDPYDPINVVGLINLGGTSIDICLPEPRPIHTNYPIQKSYTEYVPKPDPDNLFFIEPHMTNKKDPVKLAAQFFPPGWHFKPDNPEKSLPFYKDILVSTNSISVKAIYDRNDQTKVIFHSIYIIQVISMADWRSHPSDLQTLPNHDTPYNY